MGSNDKVEPRPEGTVYSPLEVEVTAHSGRRGSRRGCGRGSRNGRKRGVGGVTVESKKTPSSDPSPGLTLQVDSQRSPRTLVSVPGPDSSPPESQILRVSQGVIPK